MLVDVRTCPRDVHPDVHQCPRRVHASIVPVSENAVPTHAISNMTGYWRELDAAHHLHPFMDTKALNAEGARVVTGAQGVYITTSTGERVIDGMSGLWNVNVGHGRAEIVDAIAAQLRQL